MSTVRNTGKHTLIGRAFPPLQSLAQDAQLEFSPGGDNLIRVVGNTGAIHTEAARGDLKIDAPLGSAPRRITFPDGTLFETEDHEGVEELSGPTRGGLLHSLERLRPRMIGFVAAMFVAVWLLWRYVLDIMVSVAVSMTPPVLMEQMDQGMLNTIDYLLAEPTGLSAEQQARVERIFSRLLENIDQDAREEVGFELLLRDMEFIGPNAVAMPGGTVVMTDQFVKEFDDDDVLAGVLGHEIGHVIEKHGLRQVYRSLSVFLLIALIAGDTGPILEDMLLEGNFLLSLSYSRGNETAADEFGLRLSHRAGYDPAGLKNFFENIAAMGVEPSQWISSHPSSLNRIQAIDDFIRTLR